MPNPLAPEHRDVDDLAQLDSDLIVAHCADLAREKVSIVDSLRSTPLRELLATRMSERRFGSLKVLDLLAVIARTSCPSLSINGPDGYVERHRPFPSAGGRHPHTLVVCCFSVEGLAPGAYVVSGANAATLVPVHLPALVESIQAAALLALRATVSPPCLVVSMARFRRTTSKYPGVWGETLIWRDAGVLQQTVHLVAHDLGLASTIVGIANTASVELPGGAREALFDTGAVAIGGAGTL